MTNLLHLDLSRHDVMSRIRTLRDQIDRRIARLLEVRRELTAVLDGEDDEDDAADDD